MTTDGDTLSDDEDYVDEDVTMHSFLKIDEVYAVRRNPLIAATLQIEKLAREAGIMEDEETL